MHAVDLHSHSTKSDGSFTPTELVNYALEKGLAALALTDHDTTDGIDEALAAAEGKPIEVIPGIEFSTEYEGRDIHIVGLYIDYKSDFFMRRLEHFVKARETRNEEMCRRLTALGMPVTYEELTEAFPDSVITRAHYARYLLSHGYTRSLKEAFDRYIGDYGPCFVPRKKITPMRAVEIILKAGGIPILAHPILYHMSSQKLDALVAALKEVGLVGIEAIYSTYSAGDERDIRRLAAKYDLCISGGSDFHGAAKPGLDLGCGYGKLFVPEEVLWNLKEKHREMKEHPEMAQKTRILFTDLDGTLLNSKKQIGDFTRQTLDAWARAGHKFVLCSGRDINSVKQVHDGLQFDYPGMYIVGYNGGQIVDCETWKTIHRIALTFDQICYVRDEAAKAGLHFHTYTDTHILATGDDTDLDFYRIVIKTPVQYTKDYSELSETGACKGLVISREHPEKLHAFAEHMRPWAENNQITMMFSNPYYLEVIPAASGKGTAVRKLCELLSINPMLSIAAGDAGNDVSMIQAAGTGIAMCNGSEEARNAATMITEFDNDHDGLAHAIADLF